MATVVIDDHLLRDVLTAAMTEALAAAQALSAEIAASRHDVGQNIKAAAEHDGVAFRAL